MLVQKQLAELRELIERAGNPAFLYDNDADGFCSQLLLRKAFGKGMSIAVRSYPELDAGYVQQALDRGADCIVVLDKPFLSEAFVLRCKEASVPLIVIDHHEVMGTNWHTLYDHYMLFNPLYNKRASHEPVSFLVLPLSRPEDAWIAAIGCIADHYIPDFWQKLCKDYPDYTLITDAPFVAYYGCELGKLGRMINYGLKQSLSGVKDMQDFFLSCTSLAGALDEHTQPDSLKKQYARLDAQLQNAVDHVEQIGEFVWYQYGGATSMSSDIANYLSYRLAGKVIVVVYEKEGFANISLRGSKVKQMLERILPKFERATGGGHRDAVGARIQRTDIARFKQAVQEQLDA